MMKSEKENKLKLNFKIWIENESGESLLGDGKCKLLKAIDRTESLKLGIEECGFSYRKTWNKLEELESKLGFLLFERQRGGAAGGKTKLTPEGARIVRLFDDFHQQFDETINSFLIKEMDAFNNRDIQ